MSSTEKRFDKGLFFVDGVLRKAVRVIDRGDT
jgi:hypothetical protein